MAPRAIHYQIIWGPQLKPSQTSNPFTPQTLYRSFTRHYTGVRGKGVPPAWVTSTNNAQGAACPAVPLRLTCGQPRLGGNRELTFNSDGSVRTSQFLFHRISTTSPLQMRRTFLPLGPRYCSGPIAMPSQTASPLIPSTPHPIGTC